MLPGPVYRGHRIPLAEAAVDLVTAPRLPWRPAVITRIVGDTPRVKSFFLRPDGWPGFRAGQHVDVRLTAVGGYQAQRSYSIGSAPEDGEIELVIERLDNGEVSAFFHEAAQPGDTIEVRGPIGSHFTWGREDGGPVLLVGGGSGVVPLVSILRHRANVAPDVPATLVYSARDMQEVIFRDELFARADADPLLSVILTLTREKPLDPRIRHGRVSEALFREVIVRQGVPAHTYACGSSGFVDSATRAIIDAGVDFATVRSERYGGDPKRA